MDAPSLTNTVDQVSMVWWHDDVAVDLAGNEVQRRLGDQLMEVLVEFSGPYGGWELRELARRDGNDAVLNLVQDARLREVLEAQLILKRGSDPTGPPDADNQH